MHRNPFRAARTALAATLGLALVLAPALAPSAATAAPAVAPFATYTFDGDSGRTVADSSGHGNDATWVGTPASVPGVSGKAAAVSGGANYVKLPLVDGKTDGSGSFSYEFWMSEQSRTSYGTLFSNQDFDSCNNPGLTLYNQSTPGVLQACWGLTPGGAKQYLAGASPGLLNAWHHVAVSVDRTANVVTVYTDGVVTATSKAGQLTANTVLKSGYAFNLGGLSGSEQDAGDGFVNASIDTLSFYDAAIPATQVAADYAAQKPATVQYTVAFDGNGATGGATAAQAFAAGRSAPLTANGFTRRGYGFQGWATRPGGQVAYADGQTVSDLATASGATVTLFAVWSRFRAAGDTVAPVASYDFDDDSGSTVKDSSGRGNDATWSGTAASVDGTSGRAASVSSPAGSVQGVNFFSLPLVPGSTDGSGSFSFVFWLNETSSSSDSPIVSNQDFTHCYNRGTTLYNTAGSPGVLRGCFGQKGSSTAQNYLPNVSGGSVIGRWHQVALVADRAAGTMTAFLDGEQTVQNTNLTAAFSLQSGFPFRVGAEGSGTDLGDGFVNAAIDTFDFYDAAVPAAQIRNDFLATRPAAAVNDGSTMPRGFVSSVLKAPAVRAGGSVAQPLSGLWNGAAGARFAKVDGDSWLSVDADGVVRGTAPSSAPNVPAFLTVEASDGATTSRIDVEVVVLAPGARVPFDAVTWNLWDAGTHVNDSGWKNLAVLAANGFGVVGVQQDGGSGAARLAKALGWHAVEGAGGAGILSPYPLTAATGAEARATETSPIVRADLDVLGQPVRVFSAGLDHAGYGPEAACSGADPDALVAAEKSTNRYAQAQALAAAARPAVAESAATPVLVLGDLASPSSSDWTAATSAAHCGVGSVAWPVPALLADAGLTDAYRVANPDPVADPGATWSPLVTTDAATGAPEPQDRIDEVLFAGERLVVRGANTFVAGWPSPRNVLGNAWTSNHRAVVASFALGAAGTEPGGGATDPGTDPGSVPPGDGGAGASPGQGGASGADASGSSGTVSSGRGSQGGAERRGGLAATGGWIALPLAAIAVALLAAGGVLIVRRRRAAGARH
ncbi:InlB B-repeat-containing protein [uncultured Microbacterium sp.]|uniref:InlB B-repeat-containing protein n=1 Tax=uncultured Microbacterium sp. TaxID=191216 RepID=UPI0025FF798F|nr:InlB B-repeat-containing protein [uncultured Microbacterium sp.]